VEEAVGAGRLYGMAGRAAETMAANRRPVHDDSRWAVRYSTVA
jgi:hypothetical protein